MSNKNIQQNFSLTDVDESLDITDDKTKNINNKESIRTTIKLINMDETNFETTLASMNNITEELLTIVALRNYLKYNIRSHQDALLLNIKLPFTLDNVYIGQSAIHCNGLFAKRTINKSDVITLYPPHVVFAKVNEDLFHYFKHESHQTHDLTSCKDYSKSIDENVYCGAFPDICDHGNWLGHLINDGSSSIINEEYQRENMNKTNCEFVLIYDHNEICHFVAVIATREINKDDELFIQYGVNYWMTKNMSK